MLKRKKRTHPPKRERKILWTCKKTSSPLHETREKGQGKGKTRDHSWERGIILRKK